MYERSHVVLIYDNDSGDSFTEILKVVAPTPDIVYVPLYSLFTNEISE